MGYGNNGGNGSNDGIDFELVASAALSDVVRLLASWLPHGVARGHEYKSTNPTRSDRTPDSFSVNMTTGAWADFATGDKGGDLISLYAFLHGMNNGHAAVAVARLCGVELPKSGGAGVSARRAVAKDAPAQAGGGVRGNWAAVTPVPDFAVNAAPKAHFQRGAPAVRWAYRDAAGQLLGFVCRFVNSSGGKEVLPLVFARHVTSAEQKWTWVQWPAPRPLYLAGLNAPCPVAFDAAAGLPLLVTEGEKCADVAAGVAGFVSVSWSGGGKAVGKSDWAQCAGFGAAVLWPDRDLKFDKAGERLLPDSEQPGVRAMMDVAAQLVAQGVADIKVVRFADFCPDLGCGLSMDGVAEAALDGWDIADFVAAGGDVAAALAGAVHYADWLGGICPAGAVGTGIGVKAAGDSADSSGSTVKNKVSKDSVAYRALLDMLHKGKDGGYRACRENVFYALTELPEWRGVIAFDEFANRVIKMRVPPCGGVVGEWTGQDDLSLGLWLARALGMIVNSEQLIAGGVAMAAHVNKVHPPRDYLDGLTWDKEPRLATWLMGVFGARELTRKDGEYLHLAGRKFLIAAVARIYKPGCKVDNMLVLEGTQGRGKSTAIGKLFGDWFSDTQLDLSSKDAYAQLDGVWGYEVGEMDAFSRADSTKVKQFITSQVDRYRGAYERRTEAHARSTVFIGTTNQDEYLKDSTGGRRFWPVKVADYVDFDYLNEVRDQLWAEAVAAFKAGEAWHVTGIEQETIFTPEQAAREVGDAWLEIIADWLVSEDRALDVNPKQVFLTDILLRGLKMDRDRISANRGESARVAMIMRSLGYVKRRESTGKRRYYYELETDNLRHA